MSVQIINLRTKQPYDFRCDEYLTLGKGRFGDRDYIV